MIKGSIRKNWHDTGNTSFIMLKETNLRIRLNKNIPILLVYRAVEYIELGKCVKMSIKKNGTKQPLSSRSKLMLLSHLCLSNTFLTTTHFIIKTVPEINKSMINECIN